MAGGDGAAAATDDSRRRGDGDASGCQARLIEGAHTLYHLVNIPGTLLIPAQNGLTLSQADRQLQAGTG